MSEGEILQVFPMSIAWRVQFGIIILWPGPMDVLFRTKLLKPVRRENKIFKMQSQFVIFLYNKINSLHYFLKKIEYHRQEIVTERHCTLLILYTAHKFLLLSSFFVIGTRLAQNSISSKSLFKCL